MYEFQLTNRLNIELQSICSKYRLSRIHRILIRVGGMRKINPELMTFIFAAISRGTPAEGALLSVMIVPPAFRCNGCLRTWTTTEEAEFVCPYCRSRDVDLLSGLDLAIDFLEVECEA